MILLILVSFCLLVLAIAGYWLRLLTFPDFWLLLLAFGSLLLASASCCLLWLPATQLEFKCKISSHT